MGANCQKGEKSSLQKIFNFSPPVFFPQMSTINHVSFCLIWSDTDCQIVMRSVLELENTLGGDPGPGLGGESDFDKRQLQKVSRF